MITSAIQDRETRIEELTRRTNDLLAESKQESFKALVSPALRDLDEARLWLKKTNEERRLAIVGIVDFILMMVDTRITEYEALIKTYGPDLMAI